jgi:LPS O-antigen subunit length determinant protein (WzzB/FepE family)
MSEQLERTDIDEEINIGQLVLTLLEQWKVIFITALLAAGVGAVVGWKAPYSATLELKPLGNREMTLFRGLNDYLVSSKLAQPSPDGKPPLNPDRFVNEFLASADDPDVFSSIAAEVYKQEISQLDEAQKNEYIAGLKSTFTFNSPSFDEKRRTGSPHWTINITTTDRSRDITLLSNWLKKANQTATSGLRDSLLKRAESVDTAIQFQTEDLKKELGYQLEDYKKSTVQRLATLDEQAKIARSLGIAKATIEGTTFSANASVVTNLKSDNPLYLRGYEALEREAKLIRERKEERLFIGKLIEIEAQLRSLKDSSTTTRLRSLLEQSPLLESSFQLARIDLGLIQFKRKFGGATGALIGLFAGGFLGVVLALLIPAIRREAQNRSQTRSTT